MLGCFYTSLRNQPKRRKGIPPAAAWKAPPHMCFCRLGKITAHQSPVENPPPTGYTSDRQPVTPQRSFPYKEFKVAGRASGKLNGSTRYVMFSADVVEYFFGGASASVLDITKDIQSLTTFRRRSGDFMKQLKKRQRPVVLTVKGLLLLSTFLGGASKILAVKRKRTSPQMPARNLRVAAAEDLACMKAICTLTP